MFLSGIQQNLSNHCILRDLFFFDLFNDLIYVRSRFSRPPFGRILVKRFGPSRGNLIFSPEFFNIQIGFIVTAQVFFEAGYDLAGRDTFFMNII